MEEKKFKMEKFINDLQLEIKNIDNSTNFEFLGKKYAYLVGDIIDAEKTNMVNGAEYCAIRFSAIDALDENKELPFHTGNFTYVKDDKYPNGHIWISKIVGTSHSENIKEEDLMDRQLRNIKDISKVITDSLNTVDEEKFLYRKN